MKIATVIEADLSLLPKEFADKLQGFEGIYSRIELVNILEDLPFTHELASPADIDNFFFHIESGKGSFDENLYVRTQEIPNQIIFAPKSGYENTMLTLNIVNVDTSRKWGIKYLDSSNDSVEVVEYMPEPKVVNTALNLYEW